MLIAQLVISSDRDEATGLIQHSVWRDVWLFYTDYEKVSFFTTGFAHHGMSLFKFAPLLWQPNMVMKLSNFLLHHFLWCAWLIAW